MSSTSLSSITAHFSELEDPRVSRTKFHPLENVLVIGLCAVICGAEHFTEMEDFGKEKEEWLSKLLDLRNGIPSHDTFNAVFARLKPEEFEKCLLSWITALQEATDGKIIAIDGKTLRGSYDTGEGKAAIHMVNAWASANHLSLGCVATDEKSNEITAIPKLLQMIDVSGGLVTIDAMGCQKNIAKTIVDEGADYVLAVKNNQPALHEAVSDFFDEGAKDEFETTRCRFYYTHESGHGRDEERYYYIAPVPQDFPVAGNWPKLKAIGMAVNVTTRAGKTTTEVRYYILSKYISGSRFAEAVRGHWSVENNLHWQLDVTFREDELRIRKGHAPQNMSILMRTALSLLKNETTTRRGIKTKRKKAGWGTCYLEKLLTGK